MKKDSVKDLGIELADVSVVEAKAVPFGQNDFEIPNRIFLLENKDRFEVTGGLPGAWSMYSATFINGVPFYTANYACIVEAISETHMVASTGGATLSVVKAASGTAITSGTALHTGTFNLDAAANTPQFKKLGSLASATVRTLKQGDTIGFTIASTPTTMANMSITVYLRYLHRAK